MMSLVSGKLRYEYEQGVSSRLQPCPGFYCARSRLENGSWSPCGPCPRGFQRSESFECIPCDDSLRLYDWLYLGFMALLPILFHLNSIDTKRLKSNKDTLGLICCALLEVILAGTITLLVWEPFGSFEVKSCGVGGLADWYPIFFNPQPNFEETLHCSYEAVYPLYTILLVFYALADLLMLVIRLIAHPLGFNVLRSVYSGLYFYPLLALGHLLLGGVIYAIFPFITIISSVISCAYHFAKRNNQDLKSLLLDSFKDWRNAGIILCHWFLHAYGIISITQFTDMKRDLSLLALVPAPAILYILTVNFTDPGKLHGD